MSETPRMSIPRPLQWLSVGVMTALATWWVPLVRIKPLDTALAPAADAFDAEAFARAFWTRDLEPALATAAPLAGVLEALRDDAASACRTFGRTVGLSRSCLYLVRATGTIESVSPNECRVVLDVPDGDVVTLTTGLVFGTTVRDVTGTVDLASRADSRDLAAVASAINKLVVTGPIAALKGAAAPGVVVDFVACGQVQTAPSAHKPWKLIPLRVTIGAAP